MNPPGDNWIAFADRHPPRQDPFLTGGQRVELFNPDRDGKVWPQVFQGYLATVHQQLKPSDEEWFGVTHWRPLSAGETAGKECWE